MSRPNRYRSQTIKATGQAVSARWNINSKSLDDSIRFDADGSPVPAGLALFLRDEIREAMDPQADDKTAEREEAEAIVYREYSVHDRTPADRKMTSAEYQKSTANPNRT